MTMATPKKKPVKKTVAPRRLPKNQSEDLTPLDVHAIQIHELYNSFRKAGFPVDISMALAIDDMAHPRWFYTMVPDLELLEDEEDED
jgi:hypothetical protein